MADQRKGLSKSRLMRGLQCPKSLYLTIHSPELEPDVTASQQALFDQGHEVGAEAQKRFPSGILVKAPYYDSAAAVAETEAAIKSGANTIFEATFSANGTVVKVDILHRKSPTSGWDLIEVKSSTSVKPEYLDDVAVQMHVLSHAGQKIERAFVMHINNQCIAPDLKDFFVQIDVTADILDILPEIQTRIQTLEGVVSAADSPKIDIGPHCSRPYDCPFTSHCWQHVTSPSIFDFPGLGAKAWEFYEQGIVSANDKKFGPFTGSKGERLKAIRSKTRWVDVSGIGESIKEWAWPLLFLDFETINFAIPRYSGTRPYEQVPFQFSALLQERHTGPLVNGEFLHEQNSDPRQRLVEALAEVLKQAKSIVAYNKGFESARMKRLAEVFPKYSGILLDACERLVDPLPIFRNYIYDPNFKDSFSIKSVAPAILGEAASYVGLEVPDGGAAQRAFVELIDLKTPADRKSELRSAMLAYCRKDTEVMAQLVGWLISQTGEKAAA